MNPLTQSKNTTILPVLIALALACFALPQQARATCQEGCLTGQNTVLGEDALINGGGGLYNTAIGWEALHDNSGGRNTAIGMQALLYNTSGLNNTATGLNALLDNTTGNSNTANGIFALLGNTTGHDNTAVGSNALYNNTTRSFNIALGANAGFNITGSKNIDIGNDGVAGESATIRIGTTGSQTNTYVAGISGVTVSGGVGVIVDSSGHLGTITSSARYKEAIKPMDKASEAILALRPVAFRYKKELDPKGIPQFGLVAEEVEKINPDLVARDEQGKSYTVRYEAVNAMLLNEFLKEHRTVQEQAAAIARLERQLEALTAGLQKVSTQLEMNKPASQMVATNR
jgi:trimeric autotransporter adhesin